MFIASAGQTGFPRGIVEKLKQEGLPGKAEAGAKSEELPWGWGELGGFGGEMWLRRGDGGRAGSGQWAQRGGFCQFVVGMVRGFVYCTTVHAACAEGGYVLGGVRVPT
jgi:hypothetical protein